MNKNNYNQLLRKNKESIQLAIKQNNVSVREICTVCGKLPSFRARIPFSIFLADDYSFVCENCAERIDPYLLGMLNDWYRGGEVDPDNPPDY